MICQSIESDLSRSATDIHRAIASLREELEAIDDYHQRAEATKNASLKAALVHNRDDEMEHAAILMEWLRLALPELDAQMRKFLFQGDRTVGTAAGPASETPPHPGLGIGNLS